MKVIFIGKIGKGTKVHSTKFKPEMLTEPLTHCNKEISQLDEQINPRFRIGSVSDVTCKSCLKVLKR